MYYSYFRIYLREKTWKGLELRRETKSIGSNGKYFHAVATSNREKPKEKKEDYLNEDSTKYLDCKFLFFSTEKKLLLFFIRNRTRQLY